MDRDLKLQDSTAGSALRLPLPQDEPVSIDDAVRRLRARSPCECAGGPGALVVPGEADAVIWRPDASTIDSLSETWDFEPLRRAVGGRKLALNLPAARERHAVQALSEAGFVLQRRDLLDIEPDEPQSGRVWLVVKRDDTYRVRLCREADEETILRLFAPAFHASRSAEHWRWKYLENPWGRRWISLAVTESADGAESLAAHYAGYPVPFVRWCDAENSHAQGPEELLAVQIGDTMTAPGHRKVGLGWTSLLGRAVRHHFAHFGRQGVAFYYGFNTGKIRNFNLRFIQGRWAGSVGFYRRALPLPGTLTDSRGVRPERLDLNALPDDVDGLLHRAGPSYRMLIRRDGQWLRWRYAACPDEPRFFAVALRSGHRVVAWGVFRRHHDPPTGRVQLRWVDALFQPDAASCAGALVEEALRQPESEGAREITAWFSPRPHWWVEALADLGFERMAEPEDLGLIYLPFDDLRADETFLDVYYTWGDSDLT